MNQIAETKVHKSSYWKEPSDFWRNKGGNTGGAKIENCNNVWIRRVPDLVLPHHLVSDFRHILVWILLNINKGMKLFDTNIKMVGPKISYFAERCYKT